MTAATGPTRLVFLGCGYVARLHAHRLRRFADQVRFAFASRDAARAGQYARDLGGFASYPSYEAALADPAVDAVAIAVPPRFHFELARRALDAGKHVLVEKPAFLEVAEFDAIAAARDRAGRAVMVAENDHYKPLAVTLRRLLASGAIGDPVFIHLTSICRRLKGADDWRNDEAMAGGDAFFEEGIHWLHLAGSLGPRIIEARGFRPLVSAQGPDQRAKSMLVALRFDTGAVGTIYYSRELPSFFRGLRLSSIHGRDAIVTFESNGGFVLVRGKGLPRVMFPGFRDIRGYDAMYRDFLRAVREGAAPEMTVERAREDHRLMTSIYRDPAAGLAGPGLA